MTIFPVCLSGRGEEWDPGDESAEPRQPHPAVCRLWVAPWHHSGHGIVSEGAFRRTGVLYVSTAHLQAFFFFPRRSVEGGELFDRIIDENYNLTELDTVLFIRQICEGLQYMHKMYILHLDLKVNLL